MSLRPRLLMRLLRIAVACLALGMVVAPSAVARAAEVVWVVDAVGAESAGRVASSRTDGDAQRCVAGGVPSASLDRDVGSRALAERPPGARSVIVQRRVYLRLASLLC